MKKICPLMSTATETVLCNEQCAWYDPDKQLVRCCAIFRIVDSIDYTGSGLSDLGASSSKNQE